MYKDGNRKMTVTCICCPVALSSVSVMSGEGGMHLLRGYSACLLYNDMEDLSL